MAIRNSHSVMRGGGRGGGGGGGVVMRVRPPKYGSFATKGECMCVCIKIVCYQKERHSFI